jgi:hypothetical protein
MTHGFTAWPSDSPLGGGGYVDLSGAKNAPVEPALWFYDPCTDSVVVKPREEYERIAQENKPPILRLCDLRGASQQRFAPTPAAQEERRERAGLLSIAEITTAALKLSGRFDAADFQMYDKIFAASPRPDFDCA